MDLAKQKLKIFEQILSINDKKQLKNIEDFITNYLTEIENSEIEKSITFEEWNKQFADNQNLNEVIPEYGITLKAYRQKIFEAEIGETKPIEEFQHKIRKIYGKA
jgi:CRISPR/Cas system CMR-associated protein Cmr5 small subunit